MLQPPRNRFTLIFTDQPSVVFTPINWKELEVVLSRDYFAVDQEVTAEVRCTGVAADDITHAYGLGNSVTLRVETLSNDWAYDASYWEFKADFQTYTVDGSVVSIGFIENGIKDLIERNKGTKYDIELEEATSPTTGFSLSYSGVTLDRSNEITAVNLFKGMESLSANSYILSGEKTQSERSDSLIFTDYRGFFTRALKSVSLTVELTVNKIGITFTGEAESPFLYLIRGRELGGGILGGVTQLASFTPTMQSGSCIFEDYIKRTFSLSLLEGEFIALVFSARGVSSLSTYSWWTPSVLRFVSTEPSQFTAYPVRVMPMENALVSLLSKMTGTTPRLVYNLPEYWDANDWIPALSSGSALQNATEQKMSLSFDDVIQFLRCTYGATYDVSGTTVTIDYISELYGSTKAMDVVPINGVKIKADTEHVFNRVEVGWETDDDIENGQFEPLCKNVFSISSDVHGKTLDLVSPFKGSPYTVEQYMREKALESSKTKQQDNDVFVFCVEPFAGTNTTVLYRDHEPASTLFNIPLTPMRFLIANGRYIGVSLYRRSKVLSFVSTDRTASGIYSVGDGVPISESDGANTELVSALSLALFRPEAIELSTCVRTPNKAAIDAMRHKYFTSIDEKNGITYDFYLNDVSLPLTVGKEQEWRGLIK